MAKSTDKPSEGISTTRLYVQNLPIYVDTARLREHFAAQGEVTDACVIRTKDGKTSRRFGFVGFKTPEQASHAKDFFHRSFFDTCRLDVSFAKARESKDLGRPWSKHSQSSTQASDAAAPSDLTGMDVPEASKDDKEGTSNSKEFHEFMETMQARSKAKFWANDDSGLAKDTAPVKEQKDSDAESASESDDEYEDLDKSKQTPSKEMSDLDFLKSKMSKKVDNEEESAPSDNEEPKGTAKSEKQVEETQPSTRLFVRNLPFSAVEEDLTTLFSTYGPVTEVHMPLDDSRRRKGFAFVNFGSTVDAQNALNGLDGSDFQGRLLHVIYARGRPQQEESPEDDENLTYKQKKEKERQKQANDHRGWNASYIRGDATVGSLAQRMGVEKGDIMDHEKGNMAVKLAIGETMLVKENKDFFLEEGVDLSAIEGALTKDSRKEKQKIDRSTTVLLVKNLPHSTDEEELAQLFRKFGELGRFLLPPSKTLALVEYLEPSEARKAFRALAYKKYQHVPLYLEWAPTKVFTKAASSSRKGVKQVQDLPMDKTEEEVESEEAGNTIFVKNLNFSTKEDGLEKTFKGVGKVRKVTVARRKDPKRGMLSMGFAFVEFATKKDADRAVQTLQKTVLDGHALDLSISRKRRREEAATPGSSKEAQNKIIVRNVAFEATIKEIRELFGAFGQLKRVRMPKKFDGKHRGFAFVEFLTEQEAQNAFAALASSHLYGRHLVLEWAKAEDDLDSLRAKASKDLAAIADSDRKRAKVDAEDDDEF